MKEKAELPVFTQARLRRALELPSKGTPSEVRITLAFMVWRLRGLAGGERKVLLFSATILNVSQVTNHTNNSFCVVQRATAKSKTGTFRDYGVAEAPPNFQAGWSDCMLFLKYLLCSFCLLIWNFRVSFVLMT
jgi:hypothetical protein